MVLAVFSFSQKNRKEFISKLDEAFRKIFEFTKCFWPEDGKKNFSSQRNIICIRKSVPFFIFWKFSFSKARVSLQIHCIHCVGINHSLCYRFFDFSKKLNNVGFTSTTKCCNILAAPQGCVPSCLLAPGFDWRGWPDHQGKKSCSFILPTATTLTAKRSCRFCRPKRLVVAGFLKSVYKFASVWPAKFILSRSTFFFALVDVLKEIQASTERKIILQRPDEEVRTRKQLQKEQKLSEAKNICLAGQMDALTFLDKISRRIFKPAVL